MKTTLLALLIVFSTPFSEAQKPSIIKSTGIKNTGGQYNSNKSYIFEKENFIYIADAPSSGPLNFNLTKFNSNLVKLQTFSYKERKYTSFNAIGFRFSGEDFLMFYYTRSDRISGEDVHYLFEQKISIRDMLKVEKENLLAQITGDYSSYRLFNLYESENRKYFLIHVNNPKGESIMLFDNNNHLIYSRKSNFKDKEILLSNEGNLVVIDYKQIAVFDKKGNRKALNLNMNDGRYEFLKTIHSIHYLGNFLIKSSSDIIRKSSKYKLIENDLYCVTFVNCSDTSVITKKDYETYARGLLIYKFQVGDSLKLISKQFKDFKKTLSDTIKSMITGIDENTKKERLSEMNKLEMCSGTGLPIMFILDYKVDKKGNLTVLAYNYSHKNRNIFDSSSLVHEQDVYSNRNFFQLNFSSDSTSETTVAGVSVPCLQVNEQFRTSFWLLRSHQPTNYLFTDNHFGPLNIGKMTKAEGNLKKLVRPPNGYFTYSNLNDLYFVKKSKINRAYYIYKIF